MTEATNHEAIEAAPASTPFQCFTPFRAVGDICDRAPISFTTHLTEPMLMAASGRTFHLYKGEAMLSIRGGPTFDQTVSSVSHSGKWRYVAEGPRLHGFNRLRQVWTELHSPILKSDIWYVVAVDDLVFTLATDKSLVVWEGKTGTQIASMVIPENRTPTALCVPPHYTNKVLLGTWKDPQSGNGTSGGPELLVINFQTQKVLFSATNTARWKLPLSGTSRPMISSMTPSPFKDLCAVGFSTGVISVYQFAQDIEVCRFAVTSPPAAITALAFRLDAHHHLLASGSSEGDIHIWDLEAKSLRGVLGKTKERLPTNTATATVTETGNATGSKASEVSIHNNRNAKAHDRTVHSLIFLPNRPILISAGADNAIRQYSFDTVDRLALGIRSRCGHEGAAVQGHFYASDMIVTAGLDGCLRVTHLYSDRASWELSQGAGVKGQTAAVGSSNTGVTTKGSSTAGPNAKGQLLPPLLGLAGNAARNYQWASLVSIHDCSAKIVGWRFDHRRLEWKMEPLRTTSHQCTAVTMSHCGNFAIVGYSSGHIVRINLQNQSVMFLTIDDGVKNTEQAGPESRPALKGSAVVGLGVHRNNSRIVVVGADRTVLLFDLIKGTLIRKFSNCGGSSAAPINTTTTSNNNKGIPMFVLAHQASSLCSIAFDDNTICSYSLTDDEMVEARRWVSFSSQRWTAVVLAPDTERYIVAATADGGIFVADVPSGVWVGRYFCAKPVTSLAFHPDALFLLSTHVGERGSFLWTNNLRYGFVPEEIVQTQHLDAKTMSALSDPTTWTKLSLPHDVIGAEDRVVPGEGATVVDEHGEERKMYNPKADITAQHIHTTKALMAALQRHGWGFQVQDPLEKKWASLLLLDVIRRRNMPLMPPKVEKVPFFLPSTQELRPTFIVAPAPSSGNNKKRPRTEAAEGDGLEVTEDTEATGPTKKAAATTTGKSVASSLFGTIALPAALSLSNVQLMLLKGQFREAADTFLLMPPQRVDAEVRTGVLDDDGDHSTVVGTSESFISASATTSSLTPAEQAHNVHFIDACLLFVAYLLQEDTRAVDFALNFCGLLFRVFGAQLTSDGEYEGAYSVVGDEATGTRPFEASFRKLSTALNALQRRTRRLCDSSACLVGTFANAFE